MRSVACDELSIVLPVSCGEEQIHRPQSRDEKYTTLIPSGLIAGTRHCDPRLSALVSSRHTSPHAPALKLGL